MPFTSPHPKLDIPKCNILSYVFADGRSSETEPLWMDAANPSNSLSMAQMYMLVKRFAVGLDQLKVPTGSAIMVFSPNHIYVPMVYLGAAGSKRAFTGANPIYTVSEVAYQMKILDAAVVLIHPALLDTGLAATKEAGIPQDRTFIFSDTPCEARGPVKDWRSFLASESDAENWVWDPLNGSAAEQTVACINFSSGTTGLPKGVCIRHAGLIANTSQTIYNKFSNTKWSEQNPGTERWLAFLPLYHAYSQLWTINIACRLRHKVYVLSKFVFEDFLKYVEKYRVNAIQCAPPVLVMLQKRPEVSKYDLSCLKHILVGAAPTGLELQRDIVQRFNLLIGQGWGMTEVTCGGIMVPFSENEDESGSIGVLLPNTEAKLLGDDGHEVTKEGGRGELLIRGPQLLLGYWKNESATKESLRSDGFFCTGDVATFKRDEKGREWWWIVDRKKELIKVKGFQVAPAELEAVLLQSPDVADVAVVGMKLEEDGEELPRAYVVLQDSAKEGGKVGQKEIRHFVEEKLAKHKWLEGGVKFVDEVPKLPSGKIMRKVMKELAKKDAEELSKGGKLKARL